MTNLQTFFPGENLSLLPLTFHFGEPARQERSQMEMGTRFEGEETISHPEGPDSYDTD